MRQDSNPILAVRVEPAEMILYVQELLQSPPNESMAGVSARLAQRHWGGDSPTARAAQIRWTALNRAFADERIGPWTVARRRDQIHVPAALIAAAGVARLTLSANEVVFDIPTLLDATLQLCEPAGHG